MSRENVDRKGRFGLHYRVRGYPAIARTAGYARRREAREAAGLA